jgi:cob(I)alamin adenosyltransferase
VAKNSLRIAAIGDVDELNAAIGVAISGGLHPQVQAECQTIQNRLFDLGSDLATPREWASAHGLSVSGIDRQDCERLEMSIDRLTEELPSLREFILPGGTAASAGLHLARCVCRRAERSVLALSQEEPVQAEILQFLNRLSDWLFVAARTSNARANVCDVAWKKKEQN